MTDVADVTLHNTDDDLWDDPVDDPADTPDVSPPLEEFIYVVNVAYECISGRPCLERQALKELKS